MYIVAEVFTPHRTISFTLITEYAPKREPRFIAGTILRKKKPEPAPVPVFCSFAGPPAGVSMILSGLDYDSTWLFLCYLPCPLEGPTPVPD